MIDSDGFFPLEKEVKTTFGGIVWGMVVKWWLQSLLGINAWLSLDVVELPLELNISLKYFHHVPVHLSDSCAYLRRFGTCLFGFYTLLRFYSFHFLVFLWRQILLLGGLDYYYIIAGVVWLGKCYFVLIVFRSYTY